MPMQPIQFPPYVKAVFISLLIIIAVFFMVMAKPILVPIMISAYVAMLLTPMCNRMELRKIPRSLAAFIALLLATVLIAAIFYFIVVQVRGFAVDLESNFTDNLNRFAIRVDAWTQRFTGMDLKMDSGFDMAKIVGLIESGDTRVSGLLLMTIGTLADIMLLPVFVFFMLIYRDHFCTFIMKVFKKESNSTLMEHLVSMRKTVHAYLGGAAKVMLILAIVNTLVLFGLGIEHAIFFGVVAGFLNIIPYLGPMLGAILPFLFALLTKDSLFYPFAIVIAFTLIQFLEGTFLTPKITGANVSLNAFVTFLGLLIGGAIWGLVGMILIIPTIAILKKLFELSPDTKPYADLFGEEDTRWFRRHAPRNQG